MEEGVLDEVFGVGLFDLAAFGEGEEAALITLDELAPRIGVAGADLR